MIRTLEVLFATCENLTDCGPADRGPPRGAYACGSPEPQQGNRGEIPADGSFHTGSDALSEMAQFFLGHERQVGLPQKRDAIRRGHGALVSTQWERPVETGERAGGQGSQFRAR